MVHSGCWSFFLNGFAAFCIPHASNTRLQTFKCEDVCEIRKPILCRLSQLFLKVGYVDFRKTAGSLAWSTLLKWTRIRGEILFWMFAWITNHLNNFHFPLVSVCIVQELLNFDNYFCNLFNPSVWQNEESPQEQITNIHRHERQHGGCGAGIVGLLVILKS